MRPLFLLFVLFSLTPCAARAGQAEAREVARLNNCLPAKIEVFSQSLGPDSQTIYRIDCTMPKTSGESSAPAATALLVRCNGALCDLLRTISDNEKK